MKPPPLNPNATAGTFRNVTPGRNFQFPFPKIRLRHVVALPLAVLLVVGFFTSF